MSNDTVHLIEMTQVSKAYADGAGAQVVLTDFDLAVQPGTSLAIMGPSGSGKSTLLNILAGTVLPDAGCITLNFPAESIRWDQLDESGRVRVRRRHMGYVHQFFNLIPTLSVLENVLLPLQLNRMVNPHQAALGLLERCGLSHRLQAFPDQLSGGEQQRTAVARALVHKPALLLADEPTGNLDDANSQQVAELLLSACQETGTTLVLATHSTQLAQRCNATLSTG